MEGATDEKILAANCGNPDTSDDRFWDDARIAAERGYGTTPDSGRGQVSADENAASSARIAECAQRALRNTLESQAARAREDLIKTAEPAAAQRFSDPDEYLASLPEIREALDNWSGCMAERGYSFEYPREAIRFVDDQVASLGELPPLPLGPAIGPKSEEERAITREWQRLRPQLNKLRAEEIKIASRDIACRRSELYPALISAAEGL